MARKDPTNRLDQHLVEPQRMRLRLRLRRGQHGEEPREVVRHDAIFRDRPGYFSLAHSIARHFASQDRWIEIEHAPFPRPTVDGMTVMDLARIDHDDVAYAGFDRTDPAPRTMCADVDESDAEMIVRVAREPTIGDERHGLNAGYGRSV